MAWYQDSISHGYITGYQGAGTDTPHYADDVETPFHTPITSLFEGDVVKSDYQPWGGEVFIKTNVPGVGPIEEYFYHFDQNEVSVGQHVKRGQELGLSGGQTSGGAHPTDPHWSTGPHTHVGFFTKYVPFQGGGSIPYGPDITPWLKSGGGPATPPNTKGDACLACGPKGSTAYTNCTVQIATGFVPDCAKQAYEQSQAATGSNLLGGFQGGLSALETSLGIESNTDLLYRVGFIGAGIVFILAGILIFAKGLTPSVTLGG